MATSRTARLIEVAQPGPRARLLTFEALGGPLGFVGGQYLIFDTGLVRGEKRVKRAYSLLSADADQLRFQIAVQKVPDGAGSALLHELRPGSELQFSGPWGKFLPDDARPRRTLLLATDSGITALLGLARGRGFAPQRPLAQLLWLRDEAAGFLPVELVEQACADLGVRCGIRPLPAPHRPERLEAAKAALREVSPAPDCAFLSGDGLLLHALRDELAAAGADPANVRVEAFFNHPQRKAPA